MYQADPSSGEPLPPNYYPPPPPPPRSELSWSFRWNPLDLVFGRVNVEAEYAFWGPLSIVVAPQYIFADPRQTEDHVVSGNGWGVFSQIGFWIDGRPLRGYFLKAHVGHNEVTFHAGSAELRVPETLLGVMFGSQSIHAGWFTFSGGIGVVYDLDAQERTFAGYKIEKSGLLKNGVDLLTQLAIGGSF